MSTTPQAVSSKPRSTVKRKSTRKPQAVQTAIITRRVNGESKAQIARDLGLAVNTVSSIVELSDVERQIAEYRQTAMGLVPLAITAVETDLKFPGNGTLGLRVLESTGVLGEDAIDAVRRNSQRQAGAINVLVQAGASVTIPSVVDATSNHNATISDAPTICSNDEIASNNSTVPVNDKVTDAHGTPTGKHPKAAPTHQ